MQYNTAKPHAMPYRSVYAERFATEYVSIYMNTFECICIFVRIVRSAKPLEKGRRRVREGGVEAEHVCAIPPPLWQRTVRFTHIPCAAHSTLLLDREKRRESLPEVCMCRFCTWTRFTQYSCSCVRGLNRERERERERGAKHEGYVVRPYRI